MLAALLVWQAAVAVTPSAAAVPADWQGPATCRFVAPRSLGTGRIEWVGQCRAGKADGLGMFRPRGAGAADAAFYGRINAGQPGLGIVEVPGGFRVGRFVAGEIASAEDMDERDAAFETAAQAARQVSQHYRAKGNPASARYYRDKAAFFLTQIE